MNILAWLIVGLIAGLAAKALLPGDEAGDLVLTALWGIAGAVARGLLSVAIGLGSGKRGLRVRHRGAFQRLARRLCSGVIVSSSATAISRPKAAAKAMHASELDP